MSSKSGGPLRLTYDPTADSGAGAIVAGSAQALGGLNTVGFFADAGGNFKNSSVQLGPCDQTAGAKTAGQANCLALYIAFERSKKIERINNVDQPAARAVDRDDLQDHGPAQGRPLRHRDVQERRRDQRPLHRRARRQRRLAAQGRRAVRAVRGLGRPGRRSTRRSTRRAAAPRRSSAASRRTSRRGWWSRTTRRPETASTSTTAIRRATATRRSCATTRDGPAGRRLPRSRRTTRC